MAPRKLQCRQPRDMRDIHDRHALRRWRPSLHDASIALRLFKYPFNELQCLTGRLFWKSSLWTQRRASSGGTPSMGTLCLGLSPAHLAPCAADASRALQRTPQLRVRVSRITPRSAHATNSVQTESSVHTRNPKAPQLNIHLHSCQHTSRVDIGRRQKGPGYMHSRGRWTSLTDSVGERD